MLTEPMIQIDEKGKMKASFQRAIAITNRWEGPEPGQTACHSQRDLRLYSRVPPRRGREERVTSHSQERAYRDR